MLKPAFQSKSRPTRYRMRLLPFLVTHLLWSKENFNIYEVLSINKRNLQCSSFFSAKVNILTKEGSKGIRHLVTLNFNKINIKTVAYTIYKIVQNKLLWEFSGVLGYEKASSYTQWGNLNYINFLHRNTSLHALSVIQKSFIGY